MQGAQVGLIKHNTIPPSKLAEESGTHEIGELRDFDQSSDLARFLPEEARFGAAWIRLDASAVTEFRLLPTTTLLVVCAGDGQLLGRDDAALNLSLRAGDQAIVPSGWSHRLVAGPSGCTLLSIEADDGSAELRLVNQAGLQRFRSHALFEVLSKLELDSRSRLSHLARVEAWRGTYQSILFARQANCANPRYAEPFHASLSRELERGLVSPGRALHEDAVSRILADWFRHQMHTANDPEKLVLTELVLASALGELEAASGGPTEPWSVHGLDVLGREVQHADYQALARGVTRAWDMLMAVADRLLAAVNAARDGSAAAQRFGERAGTAS